MGDLLRTQHRGGDTSPVCLCSSVAAEWQNSEEILPWGWFWLALGLSLWRQMKWGKAAEMWGGADLFGWACSRWCSYALQSYCFISLIKPYVLLMEGLWGASLPFLMLHSNLKISGVWDLSFHWNCPNSNPWAWQNMSRLLLVETVLYLFKIQSQKSVFSSLPLKIHCCQSLQKATSCVWRPILGILLLNRECFLLKWTLWGRCSCPSSNLDDVFINIHLKKMAANKSRSFSHSLELEISDPQTLWKLQVLFEISDLLFQALPASVLLEIPTWALPAVQRVSAVCKDTTLRQPQGSL